MTKRTTKTVNKITKVQKRDGTIVPFDEQRIKEAIFKAVTATNQGDGELSQRLTDRVVNLLNRRFKQDETPHVEQIQDIVEEVLILEGLVETAKAYILYREQRRRIRETTSLFDESTVAVDKYLGELDWQVKENANMTYSLQGLNQYCNSAISKKYWLNKIYPKEIKEAAFNEDFHIHNLDSISTYCCGWDLNDLLNRGFGGVPGKLECRPPKHFRVAMGQLVNFFYTLQGESAGAQAVSNFDTLLAPFIRYDNLSYREVKQAMQEFLYNCMVPTRVGFQTPFLNVSIDIKPPSFLANQPVTIGGKLQKETYGEFQEEINMFNKAFYEVMMEGDAKGRPFTFPIPTVSIGKDFDWDNPALDPMWEATAKYGINYFSNFVNSDMKPEDFRSMCPLARQEKVLIRSKRGRDLEYSSIGNISEGRAKENSYEIYSDGGFVSGKFNKYKNQEMMLVQLENGHEIKMSKNHLNFVLGEDKSSVKELAGKQLQKGMYLPYSLNSYKGSGGNKDLGYFVGAFAGDGSFDGETTVVFSLENEKKKQVIEKLKNIAERYFGAHCSTHQSSETKLFSLKIHSRAAVGLCQDFVEGKKREKYYKARLFGMSEDFRKGVLDGHYATDGGNRYRIYTSSKKMVETISMLTATLGTTTNVSQDTRKGRLSKDPNYVVRIYQFSNKRYGDIWFKKHDKIWFKIKSIKDSKSKEMAYCFEAGDGEPIFTVGTTGILTHNCRLRLDNRELYQRGGGLFGSAPLTGSIGVCTINMPRIGYLSKTKKEFFDRLSHFMDLAKDSLEMKRKALENFMEKGLYPYSKYYLASVKKIRGSYFGNHFSTIGLLGMNEAMLNFIGEDIASRRGRQFALEVLDFMRKKLIKYQQDTGDIYNLEATPAEGTSFRQAKADKEKYPEIITAGTQKVPYYTNSSQLPVNQTDDVFKALKLQDELQCKYTGGTVLHLFLGEQISDVGTVKNLVKTVFEKFNLPYITITPTFSICPTHGYLSGEHFTCPLCTVEQPCEVYSRVVGYLRPIFQWNEGKIREYKDRKEFKIKKDQLSAAK